MYNYVIFMEIQRELHHKNSNLYYTGLLLGTQCWVPIKHTFHYTCLRLIV